MTDLTQLLTELKLPEERHEDILAFSALGLGPEVQEQSPWYITAMIGGSAWISAMFFLSFLFSVIDEYPFITGAVLMGIAAGINRQEVKKGVFLDQLSTVIGLTGFTAMVSSLWEDNLFWFLIPVGLAVFMLHTGRFHRFVTVIVSLVSFELLLRDAVSFGGQITMQDHIYHTIATLLFLIMVGAVYAIWRHETTLVADNLEQLMRPLALGLVITVSISFVMQYALSFERSELVIYGRLAGIGTLLILLLLIYQLAKDVHLDHKTIYILMAATLLLFIFPAWHMPGMVWGIILLLLSWHRQDRLLFGMSAIIFVSFIILFYYDLDMSLLNKSYLLAFTGAAMLAVRAGWSRLIPQTEVQL